MAKRKKRKGKTPQKICAVCGKRPVWHHKNNPGTNTANARQPPLE